MVTVGAAGALATVFAVAVVSKLRAGGIHEFERGVGRLWFGPRPLGVTARRVLAIAVLAGETAVVASMSAAAAVALAGSVPAMVRWAFVASGALLVVFSAAQAVALARGRSGSCACFGSSATLGPVGVARTVLLVAVAAVGAVTPQLGPAAVPLHLVAAFAGCGVGLVLVYLEDLAALWRPSVDRPARAGWVAER